MGGTGGTLGASLLSQSCFCLIRPALQRVGAQCAEGVVWKDEAERISGRVRESETSMHSGGLLAVQQKAEYVQIWTQAVLGAAAEEAGSFVLHGPLSIKTSDFNLTSRFFVLQKLLRLCGRKYL